jgi:tetratricopeptide (TPR) repeat protein
MAANSKAYRASHIDRSAYVNRFKARLAHFRFFIYQGHPGVGKTSLILRLSEETRRAGLKHQIYLRLWPGESIQSLYARVAARLFKTNEAPVVSEPCSGLLKLLSDKETALVLDDLHLLGRESLIPLIRMLGSFRGSYCIIAACQDLPELPSTISTFMHIERVGPFTQEEVLEIAQGFDLNEESTELIGQEAERGGIVCHPLSLTYLLSLCPNDLPSPEFFAQYSARSKSSFKSLYQEIQHKIDEGEKSALVMLMKIGIPLDLNVATRAFGKAITSLVNKGLCDLAMGTISANPLLNSVLDGTDHTLSADAGKVIAKHLSQEAQEKGEILLIVRAAEILAQGGSPDAATELLCEGWDAILNQGFLQAYLKTLSRVQATEGLASKTNSRLQLLSARTRQYQGNENSALADMIELAKSKDKWTQHHAIAGLINLYAKSGDFKQSIVCFKELEQTCKDKRLVLDVTLNAAQSMFRAGQLEDAEKLIRKGLKNLSQPAQARDRASFNRLLAKLEASQGKSKEAIISSLAASAAFQQVGDYYHAATAHGFVGDLYRDMGSFELAREEFLKFHALAVKSGERDLVHIAELSESWVSLDIGDLTHAAEQIAKVEKEIGTVASKRLKRYMTAAQALLAAGRGLHREASSQLLRAVDAWESAGLRSTADILRAHLVRSLLACGEVERAEHIVEKTLARLSPDDAVRRASFLRESALVHLHHKRHKKAMVEFTQARQLFLKTGNRREEVLTLHRIARAALLGGDMKLARDSGTEALSLSKKIKHSRAIALAQEIMGRLELAEGNAAAAVELFKDGARSFKKLGDEAGCLHASEWLLRAMVATGDVGSAIRHGPKVRSLAEKLGSRDVQLRAQALTAAALLRRRKLDAASRSFIDLSEEKASPLTKALMWRLGEGLAALESNLSQGYQCRLNWVEQVRMLPDHLQKNALLALSQLGLPPRDRFVMRHNGQTQRVDHEVVSFAEPNATELFINVAQGMALAQQVTITVPPGDLATFFTILTVYADTSVSFSRLKGFLFPTEMTDAKAKSALKALAKELNKVFKKVKDCEIVVSDTGIKLSLPKSHTLFVPTVMTFDSLTVSHRKLTQTMTQQGSISLQNIQDILGLSRAAAKKEIDTLIDLDLVEAIRDGRGQVFRLS